MIPGKAEAAVNYAALLRFPVRWVVGLGQEQPLEGVPTGPRAEKTPSQVPQAPPAKSEGSTGRREGA